MEPNARPDGVRLKGHPDGPAGKHGTPVPKAGQRAGKKNKITQQVKEMIADAFEQLGGVDGLVKWAKKSNANREAFYTKLWGKLVPVRIDIEHESENYRTLEEVKRELEDRGLLPIIHVLDLKANPEPENDGRAESQVQS